MSPTPKDLEKPADEIWKFECGICGDPVDQDHCWCETCSEFSGEWVQYDERGERIEP